MLDWVDHVTVVVHELEAAVAAYRSLLGAPPIWLGTQPELGTRTALFSLSNALIELVAPDAERAGSEGVRAWLAERGEGLQALAFGTVDAAAASASLRERGLRATPPQPGEARAEHGSARTYRTVELSPRSTRGLSVFAVERPDRDALRARVAATAPAAVDALDHVVLRTGDPDAAIALYRDGLGLRLALDRELRGRRMSFFRVGGVTIELVHDPALGGSDAFYGLAYRVRDLDAAHARLALGGHAPSAARDGQKPGTRVFTLGERSCGVPTLVIRDPSRDPA